MSQEKFRLVTRSDFDGLVCAVLLKHLDLIEDILFVHPKDMQDGKVADFGQDVKACALGQAAAAVLGEHVIGADLEEIEVARDALRAMLKADGPPPVGRFSELSVLAPVKDYPARHTSTLLAFEAAVEALGPSAQAAVCRELSKVHEEWLRGDLAAVRAALSRKEQILGEFVVVLHPEEAPEHA